ncbi:MAG: threonine dehydratase [Rhodospirillaceae bacterium]|nr:threonine dehydratase [Rhodospirillaceae bacterium]
MPSLEEIRAAARLIAPVVAPTPQYAWPLLAQRLGIEVWVKHENHTPTGAFKIRGGLVFMDWLTRSHPEVTGVVAATRGNHGQSVTLAARRAGLQSVILVPHGNSKEKNAAMQAFGAELIVHGDDFQESVEEAGRIAQARGLFAMPSFDLKLVAGVATYSLEFLSALPDLETVYVPIGLGSGICGMLAAKAALGHPVEVVGVVAEEAPAYALSLAQGKMVSHPTTTLIGDGMACRTPAPAALAIIAAGIARTVLVSDAEMEEAMRAYYSDTHSVAEGAGAAALAAAMQEKRRGVLNGQRRIGVVLTGQNVDRDIFARILAA